MSDSSAETQKRSPDVSSEQIARFLEQTGFVFEMRANEVLLKAEYVTEINDEFLDLEKDTVREIDITATKVINDINVHLVIECKQSLTDKWIFICTKDMPRYRLALKHLPGVAPETMKEARLFQGFHTFNRKTPLAHNYLSSFKGEKKAEHLQIDECVYKLPKALIDLASRADGGRHLFFPVALFAGQIFAVSYSGKLIVDEVSFLQYYTEFETEIYRREPKRTSVPLESLMEIVDFEKWSKKDREERIRRVTRELFFPYQIDFVTESGFPEYLAMIERQVAGVRTADWPVPEATKKSSAETPSK